jgi:2-methylcitrate dehydratase PrpD
MLVAAASPLSPAVSRAARRTLLNVLGTAASAAGSPAVTALLAAAAEHGSVGDVQVPGLAHTLDPYWGALVTGTAAHLDDFDDTHLATVIHPGAATLATVLSLAPATAPSGAAFLGAFAVGCEAQLRIGNAISPAHYDHGWHITGTCGVFGAAVAASALLGLDAEAASRALSLAATMTLGHREAFGSMTKPLHAGKAAANGVLAARLAAAGLSAPPDPLGPGGVLEVLAAAVDRDALGRGWELELNTFKTYPCGVVAHPAMDGAIAVSDRIDPAEITAITLRCHPLVPELMGTVHPADGLRSRFSARHGVAAGLLFGRAGLAEFTDAVATAPEVARLRGLITLNPDPGMPRDAAVLRIETRSADPVEVRTEHTRGSIARPLTDDELQDKVQALVTPVLGAGAADRIRKAVDDLPGASDASVLLAALRPAASVGAPGLGGVHRVQSAPTGAPNDAVSHHRRPAPAPTNQDSADPGPDATGHVTDSETTTDRLLALARQPASTLPAVTALARFTSAITTHQGIAAARTLLRALRPVSVDAPPSARAGDLVNAGEPPPRSPGDLVNADDAPAALAAHLVGADGASSGSPGSTAPADGGSPDSPGGPVRANGTPGGPAHAVGAAMPGGPALTAWVTGAAAAAAPAPDDPAAAMVVCAAARALGDDCLAAIAAGLEGAGWSVPTVAAGIGAALAAGVMLGLPEDQLRNALGVCATQAAGLRAAAGTDAGPLQAGKAAFNAVEAALLAREGFTGPAEPLDGRRGLFALFSRG